jgi:hypothetical protein
MLGCWVEKTPAMMDFGCGFETESGGFSKEDMLIKLEVFKKRWKRDTLVVRKTKKVMRRKSRRKMWGGWKRR